MKTSAVKPCSKQGPCSWREGIECLREACEQELLVVRARKDEAGHVRAQVEAMKE